MSDGDKRVGVIGLGIMGFSIARNLLKAGFEVSGYDLAAGQVAALEALGGKGAASLADLASKADILLTSLPSPAALDAVISGLKGEAAQGKILGEMSTLAIEDKARAAEAFAQEGGIMLDGPLSGTGAQAVTGDLAIYVSGDQAAFDRCAPVFAGFTRVVHYVGAFGNGSRMKFIANLLVAINNVASAEALVLGMKAGLDPQQVIKVISSGVGNSRVFELRAPLMAEQRYEPPTMKLDVWQKDMAIIGAFARAVGAATPLFDTTEPLYQEAVASGLAGQDTAAVCTVLEHRSGLSRG
jgi:3-hydroxyisobutyrate dehydrogenase-like beta-hydroxyacid dehydrogenase